MSFAILPEIAAAAVALVAARAGDRLRVPFLRSNRCKGAEQKAVVWSYNPSHNNSSDAWRPVVRHGQC
jgi:hypothetical protein